MKRHRSRSFVLILLAIIIIAAIILATRVPGPLWHRATTYWTLRLAAASSDEEEADIYILVGRFGERDKALRFLLRALNEEVSGRCNDVVLKGIIEGLSEMRHSDVEAAFLRVFEENKALPSRRHAALLAAWGLQRMSEKPFETFIPDFPILMYRKFGVSNFARTPREQEEGPSNFASLDTEIAGRYLLSNVGSGAQRARSLDKK